MTQAYKLDGGTLETLAAFVPDAKRLDDFAWYRGHADWEWHLTPRAFRKEYGVDSVSEAFERTTAERFQQTAPSVYSKCPDEKEYVKWLTLMQHHGMSTRLLDWTENPLIAIYFAVVEHGDKDGALWLLNAGELNRRATGTTEISDSDDLSKRAHHIYHVSEAAFLGGDGDAKLTDVPIPLPPTLSFQRAAAQQSKFTLHRRGTPPMEKTKSVVGRAHEDGRPGSLLRYRIPKQNKEDLLNELTAFGVTRFSLFPDLDGLSQSLNTYWKKNASRVAAPSDAASD